MENTQDTLTQLMGFIFIVAVIYLAIAFSLELMKKRAEIIHLSDRTQSPQFFMQSQPMEASQLSTMEPLSGGLEDPPTQAISQPISDQAVETAPSQLEQHTELTGNAPLGPSANELENHFAALAGGEPVNEDMPPMLEETADVRTGERLGGPSAQAESESDPTEQATAVSGSPADARAASDNVGVRVEQAETIAEETPASLMAELEGFFENQAEMTSPNQASESPPESAIKPDAPEPEGIWPSPSAAGELSELITANQGSRFPAQEYESITAIPEEPSLDQRQPYFTDERETSSELMPLEFEEVWPPVGETPTPSGRTEWFEALEALFAPISEAKHLAQETPTLIEELEELEELTAVDLEELFTSPADIAPLRDDRPKPIEELDRPTDDELEEIFGTQLKIDFFD